MYEQPAPPPPNAEKIIKTLLLEEDEESERAVRPSIHTMRCDAALYGIPEKLFIIPPESGPSSRRLERGREREVCSSSISIRQHNAPSFS